MKATNSKLSDAVLAVTAHNGRMLAALSFASPLMLVFLRNLDCPFARRTLSDLQAQRRDIEEAGVRIALVHMASEFDAGRITRAFALDDLPRFADPERHLYQALGLGRCAVHQAYGLPIQLEAAALGQELEDVTFLGDPLQMPGIVLLDNAVIAAGYAYGDVSDRPNFREIAWELVSAMV